MRSLIPDIGTYTNVGYHEKIIRGFFGAKGAVEKNRAGFFGADCGARFFGTED